MQVISITLNVNRGPRPRNNEGDALRGEQGARDAASARRAHAAAARRRRRRRRHGRAAGAPARRARRPLQGGAREAHAHGNYT